LVVSIPLGYFGGIGLASKNGILFKGGNFIDIMTKIDTIVLDKTGTLTKGVFKVQEINTSGIDRAAFIRLTAGLERNSTHPVARAIAECAENISAPLVTNIEEIAGHGLTGNVDERHVIAGNLKLLKKLNVQYPFELEELPYTVVAVAIDGNYAGYITIADEIKEDSLETINLLRTLNIKTVMLSGDKQSVVDEVAKQLRIDEAYGDLLPEGKMQMVEALKNKGQKIAFVGDGVNDAPVIALSDVGIAMGGLGSDAAIEIADVVIQNDQPSKIVNAIKVGRLTRSVVLQNITLAITIKLLVLALGAGGMANLWEAVIADVGVALLAILNAVRIQRAVL
jgi:Zn2+/Cd2+-exporting ATPase